LLIDEEPPTDECKMAELVYAGEGDKDEKAKVEKILHKVGSCASFSFSTLVVDDLIQKIKQWFSC